MNRWLRHELQFLIALVTGAEDGCKDPALAVAHRAAVGWGPAAQDVAAAAPLRRTDAVFVAALPPPHHDAQVVVTIHLQQEERRVWTVMLVQRRGITHIRYVMSARLRKRVKGQCRGGPNDHNLWQIRKSRLVWPQNMISFENVSVKKKRQMIALSTSGLL